LRLLTFSKSGTVQSGYLNGLPAAWADVAADLQSALGPVSLGGLAGANTANYHGRVMQILVYDAH